MNDEAQQVLARLTAYRENPLGALSDQELDRLLDPFREEWPRQARCPSPGCTRTLVWVAIEPYKPGLVGSRRGPVSNKLRGKGRANVDYTHHQRTMEIRPESPLIGEGPDRVSYVTRPTAPLYEHWEVRGRTEIGDEVDLDLPPDERLRWTITCRNPRCGRHYLVTHTQLLGLLVAQIASGHEYITLPVQCEVPPTEGVCASPPSP